MYGTGHTCGVLYVHTGLNPTSPSTPPQEDNQEIAVWKILLNYNSTAQFATSLSISKRAKPTRLEKRCMSSATFSEKCSNKRLGAGVRSPEISTAQFGTSHDEEWSASSARDQAALYKRFSGGGACRGAESSCRGALLLCPLPKIFAIFDVVRGVDKDKSRIFADSTGRKDFLPDTYDFVLFGVRRIVANSINARSGNFISRLIRLRLYLDQRRLLWRGIRIESDHATPRDILLSIRANWSNPKLQPNSGLVPRTASYCRRLGRSVQAIQQRRWWLSWG